MPTKRSALKNTAKVWLDPEYPPRQQAIEDSLVADNYFTLEAAHFAVNQQMHALANANLEQVGRRRAGSESKVVCVLNAGNIPFVGLSDMLSVWLCDDDYRGVLSSKSPYLLPAFAFDLIQAGGEAKISFGELDECIDDASLFVATGSDSMLKSVAPIIGSRKMLLRGSGFGAGILDGSESDDELDALAEDILLHEGMGCRNVSILWVRDKEIIDRLISSLVGFRRLFPPHKKTIARLQYERGLLYAANMPHVYSDDGSFLVSRGDPQPQSPGHLRMCVYSSVSEVNDWLQTAASQVQLAVASPSIESSLDTRVIVPFGHSQRLHPLEPPLDDDLLSVLQK